MIEIFNPAEELNWYSGNSQNKKSISEFYNLDYLYLWLFDGVLTTSSSFSRKDLVHIENVLKKQNKIIVNEKADLHKLDSKKIINKWYFYHKDEFLRASSKCQLANFNLLHHAYKHPVIVTHSYNELQDFLLKNNKIMVKEDFGFAGRNNRIFECENQNQNQNRLPTYHEYVVAEKFLNRVLDFSILWIDDQKIIYKNQVSEAGQYRGSHFIRKDHLLIPDFLKDVGLSSEVISLFLLHLLKLESYWKKQINHQSLNGAADFFIYRDLDRNNFLYVHPCCEFNPRWSMGRVAYSLFQRMSKVHSELGNWKKFSLEFCNGINDLNQSNADENSMNYVISPEKRKKLILSVK